MESASPVRDFGNNFQMQTMPEPELSEHQLKIQSCLQALNGLNSKVWAPTHGLDLLQGRIVCIKKSKIKGNEQETLIEFVKLVNKVSRQNPMLSLEMLEGFKASLWAKSRLQKFNFEPLYERHLNKVAENLEQVFCRVFKNITTDEIDLHFKFARKPEYNEKCPNFHTLLSLVSTISRNMVEQFLLNPNLNHQRKILMFKRLLMIQIICFDRNNFLAAQTINSFFFTESTNRLVDYYEQEIDSALLNQVGPIRGYFEASSVAAYTTMRNNLLSSCLPMPVCFLKPLGKLLFENLKLEESVASLRKEQLSQLLERDLPELINFLKLKLDCYRIASKGEYQKFLSYKMITEKSLKEIIADQMIEDTKELQIKAAKKTNKKTFLQNILQIITEVLTPKLNTPIEASGKQIDLIQRKLESHHLIKDVLNDLIKLSFYSVNSKATNKTIFLNEIVKNLDFLLKKHFLEIENFCQNFKEEIQTQFEIEKEIADAFTKDLITTIKKSLLEMVRDQSLKIIPQELKKIDDEKVFPGRFYSNSQFILKTSREKLEWLDGFCQVTENTPVNPKEIFEIEEVLACLSYLQTINEDYLEFPEFKIPPMEKPLAFFEVVQFKLTQLKEANTQLESNMLEIDSIKLQFLKIVEENKKTELYNNEFIESCLIIKPESDELNDRLWEASKNLLSSDDEEDQDE